VKVNSLNYLWFYSGNCLEVLKISRKSSARIVDLWVDIWTRSLPDTRHWCYQLDRDVWII